MLVLLNRRNSNRTLSETNTTTVTRLDGNVRSGGGGRGGHDSPIRGVSSNLLTKHRSSQQQTQSQSHLLVYSQRHSISDIAQTVKQKYGADSLDTGAVCDLCKVTKFTSAHSGGRVCSACKSRCCLRCSLRFSVAVAAAPTQLGVGVGQQNRQLLWICVECKRKQDEIVRSAEFPAQIVRNLTSGNSNNNNNNNKNNSKTFTSDYILNKTKQISNGASDRLNFDADNKSKLLILKFLIYLDSIFFIL